MGEFSIYLNNTNRISYNETSSAVFSNSGLGKVSVWGTEIIKETDDASVKKKEAEAQKAGYKSTACPDIFYDKQNKAYYRWNTTTGSFDALKDAKKVYEDGSYLTNDQKHILSTGFVHDKNQKKYFDAQGNEIKTSDFIAERLGYEKTANPSVYFDKKTKLYYTYTNSNSLHYIMQPMTNVEKMLPSGALVRKNGSIVDKDSNYSYIDKNGEKKYCKEYGVPMTDEKDIRNFEVGVNGYKTTSLENYYYDKETKAFYQWNEKQHTFSKTNIEEISPNGAIKKGGKYFDKAGNEIELKDYLLNKYNYSKTEKDGIYIDKKTNSQYVWNASKADFEKFDPEAKTKAFLTSKVDGEIGNFQQGEIGDCWLLAATKTLDQTPQGKKAIKDSLTTDANGNITVELKGVGKKYSFTNEELTKVAKENIYSSGDKDMLAIELAFEKYKKEIYDSNQTSRHRDSLKYLGTYTPELPLENGRTKLAIEILTGKAVNTISKTRDKNIVYKDNIAILKSMDENTLKPIFDNKNNMISVELKDADEKRGSGHAFTFKGYDEKNVYLINPYDTSKIQTMSKEEFYKKLLEVSYTQLDKPLDKQQGNRNYIDSLEVKKYLEQKEAQEN